MTVKEKHLRSVTATVPIKFTFSSWVKAITATHAASSASTAAPASTTSSHWPITNRPMEQRGNPNSITLTVQRTESLLHKDPGQLKSLLIHSWTHFSTENSPVFSPPSPAGLSKRRGGRLSAGGRLSVGGRPSPWPPWGLELSPSGLRPILLIPAPVDDHKRIRGTIQSTDQKPLLWARGGTEQFNWFTVSLKM